MITSESEKYKCPRCKQELKITYKFTLLRKAQCNVHFCEKCDQVVLSWRLFIIYPDGDKQTPIVIPVNDRIHKDFIERARTPDDKGRVKYDEECLFAMTLAQFEEYKESFGGQETSDTRVVIEAYRVLQFESLN